MEIHIRPVLAFFLVLLFLVGCSAGTREDITLAIPIRLELFSPRATIHVKVWDAAQIATDEANPICVMSGSGKDIISTQCSLGKVYQPVNPEEFSFPAGAVRDTIQITSKNIRMGEQFRVTVDGLSADGCNNTSTRYTGVVNSSMISLADLPWQQTLVGCLKAP